MDGYTNRRVFMQGSAFWGLKYNILISSHSKLYKNRCYTTVRSTFFSERILNTWNILLADVDFSSLVSFVRTVRLVDLSGCLRCFGSQLAV